MIQFIIEFVERIFHFQINFEDEKFQSPRIFEFYFISPITD
jgi:hypothetical protein